MNVKKILSGTVLGFLVSVFSLFFIPIAVQASDYAHPSIQVGGVEISGYALTDESGNVVTEGANAENYNIYYDADNVTLYLNNATINNSNGDGIFMRSISGYQEDGDDLTIVYSGNNTITGSSAAISYDSGWGLATLIINASSDSDALNLHGGTYAIESINLMMQGGTVNANNTSASDGCIYLAGSDYTEINDVNLTIKTQALGLMAFAGSAEKLLITDSDLQINAGIIGIFIQEAQLIIEDSSLNITATTSSGIQNRYGSVNLERCTGSIAGGNAAIYVDILTPLAASPEPLCELVKCTLELNGAGNAGIRTVNSGGYGDVDVTLTDTNLTFSQPHTYGISTTGDITITGTNSKIDGSNCDYVVYQSSEGNASVEPTAVNGIGFLQNNHYVIWGDYALSGDTAFDKNVTVETGTNLIVPEGVTLTVPAGITMDVKGNGAVTVQPGGKFVREGTVNSGGRVYGVIQSNGENPYQTVYTYDGSTIELPAEDNFTSNYTDPSFVFAWYEGDLTTEGSALGNELSDLPKSAGIYTLVVSQTENSYATSELRVKVEIQKATPVYTVPTDLTAAYGSTLASVTLPAGFAWQDASLPVGEIGNHVFKAIYTPEDTVNYAVVENIDISVKVIPAAEKNTDGQNDKQTGDQSGKNNFAPSTGDNSNILLWMSLMTGMALVGIVVCKKKKCSR